MSAQQQQVQTPVRCLSAPQQILARCESMQLQTTVWHRCAQVQIPASRALQQVPVWCRNVLQQNQTSQQQETVPWIIQEVEVE